MDALQHKKLNIKKHIVTCAVVAGLVIVSVCTALCIYRLGFELRENSASGTVLLLILWMAAVAAFIAFSVLALKYENKIYEQDKMLREFLDVFSSFVDAKDSYTYGHSQRVAQYSQKIAEELGLPEEKCESIYRVALLHDIGKCFVSDEILKKAGTFTEEEFAAVKMHPVKGAEMVKGTSLIPGIYDGILYHHERFDGTGYPTGKKREEIPLIGRIITVADAFDAMTSDRVYRGKISKECAVDELKENSGTQFDPQIVDAFLKALKKTGD